LPARDRLPRQRRRRAAGGEARHQQRALRHRPVPRGRGSAGGGRLVRACLRRPRQPAQHADPRTHPRRAAAAAGGARTVTAMRAAVLRAMGAPAPYAQSRPLAIDSVRVLPPGPGEVLVRVRAAGLCHSDLSVIDGSRPRPMPMLLGHEAAGEVVELGAGVATLRVGDRVVCSLVPMCGHCGPCARGRPVLCEPGAAANARGSLLGGAMRLRDGDDAPLHHHLGISGFAEYAVLSEHSAVRVDPALPPHIAALFGCAVMTGVGAVVNTAGVRPGESVAVFGLGGVGLSALLGAAACSAWPRVAVDGVPEELALARELGASHCIDARTGDVAAQVREATAGGADHAIETAGNAQVLATAYAATARGGT